MVNFNHVGWYPIRRQLNTTAALNCRKTRSDPTTLELKKHHKFYICHQRSQVTVRDECGTITSGCYNLLSKVLHRDTHRHRVIQGNDSNSSQVAFTPEQEAEILAERGISTVATHRAHLQLPTTSTLQNALQKIYCPMNSLNRPERLTLSKHARHIDPTSSMSGLKCPYKNTPSPLLCLTSMIITACLVRTSIPLMKRALGFLVSWGCYRDGSRTSQCTIYRPASSYLLNRPVLLSVRSSEEIRNSDVS